MSWSWVEILPETSSMSFIQIPCITLVKATLFDVGFEQQERCTHYHQIRVIKTVLR